jgi:hypothetical protein
MGLIAGASVTLLDRWHVKLRKLDSTVRAKCFEKCSSHLASLMGYHVQHATLQCAAVPRATRRSQFAAHPLLPFRAFSCAVHRRQRAVGCPPEPAAPRLFMPSASAGLPVGLPTCDPHAYAHQPYS